VESEVVAAEQAWRRARIEGDTAFLERFYAWELRIQDSDGSVIERDTDIALFATRRVRPEVITAEELQVKLYGDVAVVTGLDHVKGTYLGVSGEGRLRFTDVLVRRDGRWQLVANQGTWVSRTTTR
jgi:ketosteroid isomerase-like protein